MSDLISRKALLEEFKSMEMPAIDIIETVIERQPTAYDSDKVVQQLKQLSIGTVLCDKCAYREKCDDIQEKYDPDDDTDLCTMVAKSLAIEIVKGGAV